MGNSKDVLTTGEVAKICNVAPRTVSKWFDSGQLRGYRIPGSKDRRIPVAQLVRFMKAHGIPLNSLETGRPRVLILDADEEFAGSLVNALTKDDRFDVRTAASSFEAGIIAQATRPHIMLVDVAVPGFSARHFTRALRACDELSGTKLIATGTGLTSGQGETCRQDGFQAYLCKPFGVHELIRAIEGLAAVVA
ncbi:MAG: helix-turn-helix domain-containing protein [Phycisphaerales bacterium]|nr:MAG: helix-turn-helix domain-containing protein [Phycisphaerales bacterium]